MKLGIGEQKSFAVDSRLEWNASQIEVEPPERYSIAVTEISEAWQDASIKSSLSKGWSGPARWIEPLARLKARARAFPMYTLIGSVDDDPSTFFLIGERATLVVTKAGRLQAFANDWNDRYENNKGRLTLMVRRL